MGIKTEQRSYHRGNVREDLIEIATTMLRTDGISGLSLNKMAKAIGVSAPAAYNHFRNKEGLLAAVAVRGYRKLTEIKRAILLEPQIDSPLRAMSLAYLKFACDEPNLYRLMFRHEISNRKDYPELIEAEDDAYSVTVGIYYSKFDPNKRAQDYPKAFLIWSTLHGIATLISDEQIKVRNRKDLEHLADIVVEGFSHMD
jgi:AcrR family transcriptional regulator